MKAYFPSQPASGDYFTKLAAFETVAGGAGVACVRCGYDILDALHLDHKENDGFITAGRRERAVAVQARGRTAGFVNFPMKPASDCRFFAPIAIRLKPASAIYRLNRP